LKTLVTGGCGFIGSHVARYCKELGHKVIVLDDLSGGFKQNLPEDVEFIQGSVTDYELVRMVFEKYRFDYVYHLAAYAAEGLSHFIRRFNYINNIVGSVNLINASVNNGSVKRFVFTSSIAVYGSAQVPMSEDTVPRPEDPYGIAKLAVELDLKSAHKMFGLNYTVFRPHNVYGEHQNIGDPYRNVIGIFMNQIMKNEPMTIFGDGKQRRAFTYVGDVAPIIAESVHNDRAENEIFNIGADTPYTVLELAHEVASAFGVRPNIIHLPPRNEVVHAFSNHEKLKKVFGDRPDVDLRTGIKRMAEWAMRGGPKEGSSFPSIEVPRNMPPVWSKLQLKDHTR